MMPSYATYAGLFYSNILRLKTRHKYVYLEDYYSLLRETRTVVKEFASTPLVPMSNKAPRQPAAKHPLFIVEAKEMETRIFGIQTFLFYRKKYTHIDSKFHMILQ